MTPQHAAQDLGLGQGALALGESGERVIRGLPCGSLPSDRTEGGADMANEHFLPEIDPYRTGRLRSDDLHTL